MSGEPTPLEVAEVEKIRDALMDALIEMGYGTFTVGTQFEPCAFVITVDLDSRKGPKH